MEDEKGQRGEGGGAAEDDDESEPGEFAEELYGEITDESCGNDCKHNELEKA